MIESVVSNSGPNAIHARRHDLALVTVGNTLRADDGVGRRLLANLPSDIKDSICMFDAGIYTSSIPLFIDGHKTGIVLDAFKGAVDDSDPDSVVIDISDLSTTRTLSLDRTHAISWLNELVLCRETVTLPARLLFFGVSAVETGWSEGLSVPMTLKLQHLTDTLSALIRTHVVDVCTKQQ